MLILVNGVGELRSRPMVMLITVPKSLSKIRMCLKPSSDLQLTVRENTHTIQKNPKHYGIMESMDFVCRTLPQNHTHFSLVLLHQSCWKGHLEARTLVSSSTATQIKCITRVCGVDEGACTFYLYLAGKITQRLLVQFSPDSPATGNLDLGDYL